MACCTDEPPGGASAQRGKTQGFPKRDRLTRPGEFNRVYENGRKYVGRFMVLWVLTPGEQHLRLGVVAGRKTGESVARSRAKRRLRELFRTRRDGLTGHADLVLVARRPLVKAPWPDIIREFERLVRKAGLSSGRRAGTDETDEH